jgi:hypothetical protein
VKELATAIVNIKVVIAPTTIRRHLSLRLPLRSPFAFSSMVREPSLHFSLCGLTSANGVPSAKQNAS